MRQTQAKCLNQCDYSFEICVTGIQSNISCGVGSHWHPSIYGAADTFEFPVKTAVNPLLFPFSTWKVYKYVYCLETSVLETENDYVCIPEIIQKLSA